jgi:hypothetical protein
MSTVESTGSFEDCVDDLNDFVNAHERYAPTVLAFALRAHLCGVLHAVQIEGVWSAAEVAEFVEDLVRETGQTGSGSTSSA